MSVKRPKILWLTKCLGLGGVERLVVVMARIVDHEKYDVHLGFIEPADESFTAELEALGVTVHGMHGPWWPLLLRQLIRREDFDLVHSHSPLPGAVARLVARGQVRFIHSEHNRWPAYNRLTRAANRLTIGRNDALYAVSGQVAETMYEGKPELAGLVEVVYHGFDDSAVIPVNTQSRAEARRRLQVDDDIFVIGTVGNLRRTKDHSMLLRAVRDLVDAQPDVRFRLFLVGEGPLEAHLLAEATDLELSTVVQLIGSRSDVPHILPGFDLYVISSRHEGLPLALLEALATGLPVVTTPAGGILEAVDESTAIITPIGDARAMGEALDACLETQHIEAGWRNWGQQWHSASQPMRLCGCSATGTTHC